MDETKILYPLDEHHFSKKDFYSDLYKKINKFIQKNYQEKQFKSLEKILTELNVIVCPWCGLGLLSNKVPILASMAS